MEVIFKDDHGEKYVWTPKWSEMQNLYATAERVEELNEGGGEDLEQLKALQRFSNPTLTRLAKCLDHHTSHSGLEKEFQDEPTTVGEAADSDRINDVFEEAEIEPPDYPDRYNLADQWKILESYLKALNRSDYQNIIAVIEALVHRNRHVDEEDRRRTIIEELNKVLNYENMEIGLNGKVRPIKSGSEG